MPSVHTAVMRPTLIETAAICSSMVRTCRSVAELARSSSTRRSARQPLVLLRTPCTKMTPTVAFAHGTTEATVSKCTRYRFRGTAASPQPAGGRPSAPGTSAGGPTSLGRSSDEDAEWMPRGICVYVERLVRIVVAVMQRAGPERDHALVLGG